MACDPSHVPFITNSSFQVSWKVTIFKYKCKWEDIGLNGSCGNILMLSKISGFPLLPELSLLKTDVAP
jgi:hypothetical protein